MLLSLVLFELVRFLGVLQGTESKAGLTLQVPNPIRQIDPFAGACKHLAGPRVIKGVSRAHLCMALRICFWANLSQLRVFGCWGFQGLYIVVWVR